MFAYYFLFSALCVLLDNAANFNLGCFLARRLYSAEYLLLYAEGARLTFLTTSLTTFLPALVAVALSSRSALAKNNSRSSSIVPRNSTTENHTQLSLAVDCIAIAIQSVVDSLTTLHLILAVTNTSFAPIAVPADTAVKNKESLTTKNASDNAEGP
ncbi:MAG: hypothetical protein [Circular genetic element sp.]|nr:MAG: hypothetical protein [Circular genetic element sp.]